MKPICVYIVLCVQLFAQTSKIDYRNMLDEDPERFQSLLEKGDPVAEEVLLEKYPMPSIEESVEDIKKQGISEKRLNQLRRSMYRYTGNILENQKAEKIASTKLALEPIKDELINVTNKNFDQEDPMRDMATEMLRWFEPDAEMHDILLKNLYGKGHVSAAHALYAIFYYDLDTPELREDLVKRLESNETGDIGRAINSEMSIPSFDFPEAAPFFAKAYIDYYSDNRSFNINLYMKFSRFPEALKNHFEDLDQVYQRLLKREDIAVAHKKELRRFLSEIPVENNPYEKIKIDNQRPEKENGLISNGGSELSDSESVVNSSSKESDDAEKKHKSLLWVLGALFIIVFLAYIFLNKKKA